MTLQVWLASVPGDGRRAIGRQVVKVASIEQAARLCGRFIERHGLKGGDWPGGVVQERDTGRIVARVAYDGEICPCKPGDRLHKGC